MKRKFFLKFLTLMIFSAILAVSGLCAVGYFSLDGAELSDVPYFSTERFREPDGTVASVFASGDQYYNYLHDKKGRILIPDGDGYLRYAKSDNGRPVATATRWNAGSRVISRTETMTAADLDFEKNPDLRNDFGSLGASTDVAKLVANAKKTDENVAENALPECGAIGASASRVFASGAVFDGSSAQSPTDQSETASNEGVSDKRRYEVGEVGGTAKVLNSVVFLRFPDESERIVTEGVLQSLSNEEGRLNTLNDYFESVSANSFGFYNVLPYQADGSIFVYTAPNPISYYRTVASSGLQRQREEGALLGGALAAAKPYLEAGIAESGYQTDGDGDGSVDSVTFLVLSDEPGSDAWNTLLWPHQWSFGSVFVSETLGNAKADRYLFMFTSSSRFFPVLTHEMGHVVGAPDLYHYSGSYSPVGYYDNMASSSGVSPNFWLTATREKYLADAVKPQQVAEITENWDGYTLKATSAAGNGLLAYKIKLSANEWLYLEYRQPNIGRYDNNFNFRYASATSGLVVYRVKEGVYGNDTAKAPGIGYYSSPDEIYVFRNDDISVAALNETNVTIGSSSDISTYRDGNLYLTNGKNSGIVVTLKEIDQAAASVRFEVYHKDFPAYSGTESLDGLSVSSSYETIEPTKIDAFYGKNLEFDVYPVYQKGSVRSVGETPLSRELFTISGYNPLDTSLNEQRVTVVFDAEKAVAAGFRIAIDAEFPSIMFAVTVRDYDAKIEILSLTNRSFLMGTTGGFVADWKIVTAMGNTSAAYNLTSPQTKQLRYEFADDAESTGFTKTVRVFYKNLSATVTVEFYDKAVSARYLGESAFARGTVVSTLPFEIVYLSGMKKEIEVDAAKIGFSTASFGSKTIAFNLEGEDLNVSVTVFVYGNASSYRLLRDGKETPKEEEISLRYGESIDFSRYVLAVIFENENTETNFSLDGRIAPAVYTYDEKLTVSFPEVYRSGKPVSVAFRVAVALKNETELLSSTEKSIKIDYKNKLIVLESSLTARELECKLKTADYLVLTVTDGEYGRIAELKNRRNEIVLGNFRFRVVLRGDANGDGRIDADDVNALARLYLEDDSAYRNAVGDKNGDGAFTLVDFSLWLTELKREETEDA